jgi:hypothetical protein
MQPYNYNVNSQMADPSQAFAQGMQNASGLAQGMFSAQKAQLEAEKLKAEQAENAAMRTEFEAVAKNPTSAAVRELMIKRPQFAAQFKLSQDALSDNEKQNMQTGGFSVLSALEKGRADIALSEVERQMKAAKDAGDEAGFDRFENMSLLIKANPDAARFYSPRWAATSTRPR